MHHQETCLHERLGLLLAGGGARCRRLVGELGDEPELLDRLRTSAVPQALLTTARHLAENEAHALLERLDGSGWQWLTPEQPGYPELLRHLADPPLGLFVRGALPAARMVAIVGSRRATGYGRQVARMLGEEMGRAGVGVVSGMAIGIDTAAHEGALAGHGSTVAVWGTGPDQVYPNENRRLAEEIAGHGALVTEYPPGTPPRRHHFPERNRIIAGMARAVVIVEAAARSGALITARLAIEEGREVLAVPGSIFSELSLGPNALLRMGARPLLTPRDLLEELSSAAGQAGPRRSEAGAAEPEDDGLLRFLPRGETISVDDLANRAELPVIEILPELLELELTARVERLDDGRYSRR
jgi:DNA processing protein